MTDKTGPKVTSFVRTDLTASASSVVHYTLTFDETVTSVDVSDFVLNTTGSISGASITSVDPVAGSNGEQYTFTVNTGTGSGTIGVGFANNATIYDTSGNAVQGGTFVSTATLQTGNDYNSGLQAADLNGDGKLDIAYTGNNGTGGEFNSGNGSFSTNHNSISYTSSLVTGDLDGDGKAEIAVSGNGAVYIYSANNLGNIYSAIQVPGGGNTINFSALALGDVNGDGKLDLIGGLTNSNPSEVVVYLGNGDKTFGDRTYGQSPVTTLKFNNSNYQQSAIAVADFNGDGKADILDARVDRSSSNLSIGEVSISIGNGDGTFQNQSLVATLGYVSSMQVVDINGDGRLDVIGSTYASDSTTTIFELIGNGDGTFQTSTLVTGKNFTNPSIADINGDGYLDIVYGIRSTSGNSTNVLYGNGNGTFKATTVLSSGGGYPGYEVTGDFNNDGRPDIAVALTDGSINILTNTVAATGAVYYIDRTPPSVSSAAISGNGISNQSGSVDAGTVVHIVLTMSEATSVNGGTPTLTLSNGGTATLVSGSGSGMLTFDYTVTDGQDVTGLAVTGLNAHGATFTDPYGNPADLSATTATFANVNVDTIAPHLTSLVSEAQLTDSYSATFDVTFSEAVTGLTTSAFSASGVAPAFVTGVTPTDGSGKNYIVTVAIGGSNSGKLTLTYDGSSTTDIAGNRLADGAGKLTSTSFDSTSKGGNLTLADLNGDGKLDILTTDSGGILKSAINQGDGTYMVQPATKSQQGDPGGAHLVTADLNGDGTADLITTYSIVDPNGMVGVRLGNGDGTFGSIAYYATDEQHVTSDAFAADVDGDGKLDIIATDFQSIRILQGDGKGGFADGTISQTGITTAFAVADLNGDGKPDVVTAANGNLDIRNGDGSGDYSTVSSSVSVGSSERVGKIVAVDLNHDGKLDLVASSASGGRFVSVMLNNGDGTFRSGTIYDSYPTVGPLGDITSVAAGDLNGDGNADLIVTRTAYGVDHLDVLYGNGSGGFSAPSPLDAPSFSASSQPTGITVAAGDVSGDGLDDIVSMDSSGNVTIGTNYASTTFLASVQVDHDNPTVVITSDASGPLRAGQVVTVNFTFSTEIDNFHVQDLAVSGGALDNLQQVSPTVWQATFTPDVSDTEQASIRVLASGTRGATWDDLLNHAGQASDVLALTGDTKAPGPVTTALKVDSGTSSSDGITNNAALTGTADPGAVIKFSVDGVSQTTTATANASGVWTYTPTKLSEGAHDIGVTVTDGTNTQTASLNITYDKTAPTITGVTATEQSANPDGTIQYGEALTFNLTLSEAVNYDKVSGSMLKLSNGGVATLLFSSTPTELVYAYSPPSSVVLPDLKITGLVTAANNPFTDLAGNVLNVTGAANKSAGLKIDTSAPTVTSVTATMHGSNTAATGLLKAGDEIDIHVKMSEGVTLKNIITIPGFPDLPPNLVLQLNDGGSTTYDSTSSTATDLVFNYTVGSGEATNALAVTGLDRETTTATGNTHMVPADFSKATATFKSVSVDAQGPSAVKITASPSSAYVNAGDIVTFTVTTNEKAFVTGTPSLALDNGGFATYVSGSGTTSLVFKFTVDASENSKDLSVTGAKLSSPSPFIPPTLDGGTIKDALGNSSNLPGATGTFTNIHVDNAAPSVKDIAVVSDGFLALGEKAVIKVDFGEAVTLTGAPILNLGDGVGGKATYSAAASDLAHGMVAFTYIPTAGASASNLELISLDLKGGAIKDLAGNAADISSADNLILDVFVDTDSPTGEVSAVFTNPGSAVGLGGGLSYELQVQQQNGPSGLPPLAYPNDIFVKWSTGAVTPLNLSLDSNNPFALSNVVVAGKDAQGISVVSVFSKSGDTITDYAGNKVDLSTLFTKGTLYPNTHFDGIVPTVKSMTATPSHTGELFTSDTVTFALKMSENVNADAGATLTLSNGSVATLASAVSGSDTLTFTYAVGNESTIDLKVTGITGVTDLAGNAVGAYSYDTKTAVNVYTWKGDKSGNGSYDDPTMWVQGKAPPSTGDATVQINKSGTYTVSVTNTEEVGAINIGKGVTLGFHFGDEIFTIAGVGDQISANAGTITVTDSLVLGGTKNYAGSITLANSGSILLSGSGSALGIANDVTLSGGGKVVLKDSATASIYVTNGDHVVTNTDNTISGAGKIDFGSSTFKNQAKGVVDGNGVSNGLDLSGYAIANAGTLKGSTAAGLHLLGSATNSGLIEALGTNAKLFIESASITNTASGVILASGTGAHVDLTDAGITGGTLKSVGTGAVIQIVNGFAVNFDGVNNTGAVLVTANNTLRLFNTINNTGTITIGGADSSTSNTLTIDGATLAGTGKIVLFNNGSIASDSGPFTLTNAGNTIMGAGQIGDYNLTLINQSKGVINASDAKNALTIGMSGNHHVANAGLIEATTGTLKIVSTDIDNTGTLLAASSGTVMLDDTTVTGGSVTVAKGAFLETGGEYASIISGAKVTNAGIISASEGDLLIQGSLTNTGVLLADNHHLNITGAVTGIGSAMIAENGLLELGSATTLAVAFQQATTGELELHNSAGFAGKISGFVLGDSIDLADIAFATLTNSFATATNTLTLGDGKDTAKLTFTGSYAADVFHFADDGHGGTSVTLGTNHVINGDGNDNTLIATAAADIISGSGHMSAGDTVSYANSPFGVTVDLSLGFQTPQHSDGYANGDYLSDIQNVTGSAFADRLVGDSNANTLTGGLASDMLTGGGGADNFQFKSVLDGGDEITDFTQGTDHILISRSGFGIAATIAIDAANAAQDFGLHYLVNGATGTPTATETGHGQFLFNEMTSQLFWDDDGKGAHAAKLVATLDNVHAALTAHDFGLV